MQVACKALTLACISFHLIQQQQKANGVSYVTHGLQLCKRHTCASEVSAPAKWLPLPCEQAAEEDGKKPLRVDVRQGGDLNFSRAFDDSFVAGLHSSSARQMQGRLRLLTAPTARLEILG